MLALVFSLIFALGSCKSSDKNNSSNTNTNNSSDNTSSHSHEYQATVTNPTCTDKGYTTYICACGNSYVADETNALGHTEVIDEATAPTCTQNGLTEGKHCSTCGETLIEQTTVGAYGHNTIGVVCTVCQEKIGSEGLSYTLSEDEQYYTLSGIGTCTDKEIVIPCSYNNLPVTIIGGEAFKDCYNITSITIPNGITTISSQSFYNCSSLESINIPASVVTIQNLAVSNCTSLANITVDDNNANYKSIDGNLYTKDGKTLVNYAIGKTDASFTIPDGVEKLGIESFAHSNHLTSVTMSNSVTEIGVSAFYNCQMLKNITFSENVTNIGTLAFYICTSLTNVVLPNNLTTIDMWAFMGCSNLSSINIPSNTTSIGEAAFQGCHILSYVVFEDPNNWCHANESISISELSNPQTAATLLLFNTLKWSKQEFITFPLQ